MMKRAINLSLASFTLAPVLRVTAQPCEPGWHALGGVDDSVGSMTLWDRDGPGPDPTLLVVGGSFTMAGGAPANRIAALNLTTGEWSAMGDGLDGTVSALATLSGGDLVAGGSFRTAAGVPVNGIARWDGSGWHPLGSGMSGSIPPSRAPVVLALETLTSGDLVAGGTFTHAGGVEVNGIARWDGDGWRSLGGGTGTGGVGALALAPDDSLLAGVETGIARWDGGAWAPFGERMFPGILDVISVVEAMLVTPGRNVVAGGTFSSAGGVPGTNRIARWDGAAWRPLGGGMSGGPFGLTFVLDVAALGNGDLVASGAFDAAGGTPALNIARWDGGRWQPLGAGLDRAAKPMILLPDGDLVVGGSFRTADGIASPYLAIWRDCPACYADCDGTGDLTFFDFLCFQNLFAAMDPAADCDGDTAFTFFDFLCFQNAFAAGCP